MPRYSPIAPIRLLERMFHMDVLGNYLLLLAHDVLENQYRYAQLIGKVRLEYDGDVFIIMDNSLVELGEALSASAVIEAAGVVKANCIMTPDALGGYEETRILVEAQTDQLYDSGFPLMKVPQGADHDELMECVDWFHDHFYVVDGEMDYWGIPRWITNTMGSRGPIISYINVMGHSGTETHLLGMSKDFDDDIGCTQIDGVMGIDSANPVVLGQRGLVMEEGHTMHVERDDYWNDTSLSPIARRNIRWVRDAINC